MKPPKPFEDPGGWPDDPGDKLLPKAKGFITDWVLSQRGSEVPTLFGIWTALFAVSVALKREAWLKWGQGKFYTNVYVLLIGPPGLSKKSTAVSQVSGVLREMTNKIYDRNLKKLKDPNIVMGKATPESILEAMQEKAGRILVESEDGRIVTEGGRPKVYNRGNDLTLILSELTSMFSRQKYADALTDNLLDVYDCHDIWDWRTVKRGSIKMTNLYTTLLGATTPHAFQNSVPESVIGDGFLSRTALIYVPNNVREYWQPEEYNFVPTRHDLAERLAYIAQNCWGEHYFDEEASKFFATWYSDVKRRIEVAPAELQGSMSRLDGLARKVALFMKAQRYSGRRDKVVTKPDVEYAVELVERTFGRTMGLLRSVVFDEISKKAASVLGTIRNHYIKHGEPISRTRLLQNNRVKAKELTTVISLLYTDGSLKAYNALGKEVSPRYRGNERYMATDIADEYSPPEVDEDEEDG